MSMKAILESRQFCQRGSNFDNVFLVDEGISRAIIGPPWTFRWRADGSLTLNAGLVSL